MLNDKELLRPENWLLLSDLVPVTFSLQFIGSTRRATNGRDTKQLLEKSVMD